jgi:hypothetical protein
MSRTKILKTVLHMSKIATTGRRRMRLTSTYFARLKQHFAD